MLRKNVSISNAHLRMIDSILKKHKGNLSATIREIVEFAGFAIKRYGSIEKAKEMLSKEEQPSNYFVDSIYGVTIPLSMFRWLLKSRSDSHLPLMEEVTQLFMPEPGEASDFENVIKSINEKNSMLNWPLFIKTHKEGNKFIVLISGSDTLINKFEAMLISMYLANIENPLKLENILKLPSSIQLQFIEGDKGEAKQAIKKYYGDLEEIPV